MTADLPQNGGLNRGQPLVQDGNQPQRQAAAAAELSPSTQSTPPVGEHNVALGSHEQAEADLDAVRTLLDGIDELPVPDRAERFEQINRRIVDRLAEFDDI